MGGPKLLSLLKLLPFQLSSKLSFKLGYKLSDKLRSQLFRHQRTFIVPSRMGFYFAFLCLVLLGVAFIHNNNIVYFCAFMLTSLGITTMFHTNFNMDRVFVKILPFAKTHADHPTTMRVSLENRSNQAAYQISLSLRDPHQLGSGASFDVPVLGANQHLEIEIPIVFKKRGHHWPPKVVAETRFPFGLLRSWKVIPPTETILVYPSAKGSRVLPTTSGLGNQEAYADLAQSQQGQDFTGHRPYQSSDSLRHIDWTAFARQQKLNVKLFEQDHHGTQLLSWMATNPKDDIETRLSQLTLWIEICHQNRRHFYLELPHWKSSECETTQQFEDCLRQLAEFPTDTNTFHRIKTPIEILRRWKPKI